MVKSSQENGNGTTAADRTATAGRTGAMRVGEPSVVTGPGFGLAGLV
jgi:hypothetical protein